MAANLGDFRLADWRECGHHPRFGRPGACVEKLEGPLPHDFVNHPTQHDEMTNKGLGQWISVGLILDPDAIERLARSVADFQGLKRSWGEG